MGKRFMIVACAASALLTALNVALLVVTLTREAHASVAGMSARDLIRDRDFRIAVAALVEDCTVQSDRTSISC